MKTLPLKATPYSTKLVYFAKPSFNLSRLCGITVRVRVCIILSYSYWKSLYQHIATSLSLYDLDKVFGYGDKCWEFLMSMIPFLFLARESRNGKGRHIIYV